MSEHELDAIRIKVGVALSWAMAVVYWIFGGN